jgi:hypothetical protein
MTPVTSPTHHPLWTRARRARSRRLLVVVAVGFLGTLASAAVAAPSKKVGVFASGKSAKLVDKAVGPALKRHGYTPVKAKVLVKTAKSLHVGLQNESGLAAVARRLKLAGIVVGEVGGRGKKMEIRFYGADGSAAAEGSWSAAPKKLPAVVASGVWDKIGPPLEEAREAARRPRREEPVVEKSAEPEEKEAAPAAAPAVAEERHTEDADEAPKRARHDDDEEKPKRAHRDEEASDDEKPRPAPSRRRHSAEPEEVETTRGAEPGSSGGALVALDAMVGYRAVGRNLSWVKDTAMALRPMSMFGAAAVGFDVAWYPAAHFMNGWPANIGIVGQGEYTPSIQAKADGIAYPSAESDYWGGLRYRLPLGALDVAFTGAYGQQAFIVRSGSANRADLALPDARYTYVRIGADGRVRLPANLSLMIGVAYRYVLDAGKNGFETQSQVFFPRATTTAFDAVGALGYRFSSLLEARAGVDFRRYGMDMHPQMGDPLVVSGAVDQYLSFWVTLAMMLGGSSGG